MDATVGLAKLDEQRARAAARVSALEREWREAVEQSRVASAALADVERNGGNSTSRRTAEQELATAKAKAGEPWAERLEGARARARDADRARREYVAAHLGELLDEAEADGHLAAQAENDAAARLVVTHLEVERIASRIASLCAIVGRPSGSGDVSYGRPEAAEAAKAAAALAFVGGEQGPRLDRSREPWRSLLGADDAVEVTDDVEAVTA